MVKKKTVSPYVHADNWDLCRELGYNMSEEIDNLMETLIGIKLQETDEKGAETMSMKRKLQRQLEMIDSKREEVMEKLEKAIEREKRFKLQLKTIQKNREYSAAIRDLNELILRHQYKIQKVLTDNKYEGIEKKLQGFGRWAQSDLASQVIKIRRMVEGY